MTRKEQDQAVILAEFRQIVDDKPTESVASGALV
jgi:hypothetical protein